MSADEKRNLAPSDSMDSDSGRDNRAFDPDESSVDTFSSDEPKTDKADELSDKKKPDDVAVDMEMADFSPPQKPKKSCQSSKKDDHFVSVNEHKKGLRSEKLYVTKDNRSRRDNKCKSAICITISVLFLATAIVLASLLGVGIIDPMHSRGQAGFKGGRSRDIILATTTVRNSDGNPEYEFVVDSNNLGNEIFPDFEDDDDAMPSWAVRDAFEGDFEISNVAWNDELADETSEMFREMSGKVNEGLQVALVPHDLRRDASFFVDVVRFDPGSVRVHFRMSWQHVGAGGPLRLRRDAVLRNFADSLRRRHGLLSDIYEVVDKSLNVNFVQDECFVIKCGGQCRYNYEHNTFECTCPDNAYLNDDGSSCVLIGGYDDDSGMARGLPSTTTAGTTTTISETSTTSTTTTEATTASPTTTEATTSTTSPTTTLTTAEATTTTPKPEATTSLVLATTTAATTVATKMTSHGMTTTSAAATNPTTTSARANPTTTSATTNPTTTLAATNPTTTSATTNPTTTSAATNPTTTSAATTAFTTTPMATTTFSTTTLTTTTMATTTTALSTTSEASTTPAATVPQTTTAPPKSTSTGTESSEVDSTALKAGNTPDLGKATEKSTPTDLHDTTATSIRPSPDDVDPTGKNSITNVIPDGLGQSDNKTVIGRPAAATPASPKADDDSAEDVESSSVTEGEARVVEIEKANDDLDLGLIGPTTVPVVTDEGSSLEEAPVTSTTTLSPDSGVAKPIEVGQSGESAPNEDKQDGSADTDAFGEQQPVAFGAVASNVTAVVSHGEPQPPVDFAGTASVQPVPLNRTVEDTSPGVIDISIPLNVSHRVSPSTLKEQLESLITKIVTEMTTEAPASADALATNEASAEVTTASSSANADDVPLAESFSVSIPNIANDMDAEELEDRLRNFVGNVTERLEDTTPESGDAATVVNFVVENNGADNTTVVSVLFAGEGNSTTLKTFAGVPRSLDFDSAAVNQVERGITAEAESLCNVQSGFRCGNGTCISPYRRCDGIYDCEDDSDEADCRPEERECPDSADFQCPDGSCLPGEMMCDGSPDCADGEDEEKCGADGCDDGRFYCPADGTCIGASLVCDGANDCRSGDDEIGCECDKAGAGKFRCEMGGGCIDSMKICDGAFDCPDASDEWKCFGNDGNNGSLVARLNDNSYGPVCSDIWNVSRSDPVCQQMNFVGVAASNPEANETEILQVDAAEAKNNCSSQVNLVCEDFDCGDWPLADGVKESLASGQAVQMSGWPSLAKLVNSDTDKLCTASIIGPRWLLAAHSCLAQSRIIDGDKWSAKVGEVQYGVRRIVSHPFAVKRRGFHHHNMAAVELESVLTFDQTVRPICLSGTQTPENGSMCITAGWTNNGEDQGEQTRQYVDYLPVPDFDTRECNSTVHYNGRLGSSDVCTGTRIGRPKCQADFGAPMMCVEPSGSRWKLFGILSREGECAAEAAKTHPDVFTSAAALSGWISNTVGR